MTMRLENNGDDEEQWITDQEEKFILDQVTSAKRMLTEALQALEDFYEANPKKDD